jgi:lipopolysaccharide export system protein LptA
MNAHLLHPLLRVCTCFVALWLVFPASAEKADRLKPLNVEADAGRYDDLKQAGVFTGNVVMSKGSLVMRSNQFDVRQTPEGYHQATALGSASTLASFKQKREGLDETIEGQAERIDYDARANTLRLQNRAVLRRLRAGILVDETVGNVIHYDNASEVFTVVGGAASASPENPTGRVRAVLSPREGGASAPEVAAPPASAAPPPRLKLVPTLGERR